MSDPGDDSWQHRFISANGGRFHVVEAGRGPLVLLLHGFPHFWWAWRHQIPVLADCGYHAMAMDLRGYGTSDKTPRGYDPQTLAADVAGVIRSAGARRAIVVGQGWGGYIGWAVAAGHPAQVRALCAVSAPHPLDLMTSPQISLTKASLTHVLAMQVPLIPEQRIRRGTYIARHLQAWSAPGNGYPSESEVSTYRDALSRWPSPHCALEYHRWLLRSRLRTDGRAFAQVMKRPIDVPVLLVNGAADPAIRRSPLRASRQRVTGPCEEAVISAAGHFPHEEAPQPFNAALLAWLSGRAGAGVD